jgi:hypothetical protein
MSAQISPRMPMLLLLLLLLLIRNKHITTHLHVFTDQPADCTAAVSTKHISAAATRRFKPLQAELVTTSDTIFGWLLPHVTPAPACLHR